MTRSTRLGISSGCRCKRLIRVLFRMLGACLARLPEGTELVLDYTGVGRPVFDLFEAKGFSPYGVSITSGTAVTKDKMHYSVPKLTLISTVEALLHDGRLKIQKGLPDVQVLVAE